VKLVHLVGFITKKFDQYRLSLPVGSLIVYNVVDLALVEQMREETTILVT